MHTRLTAVGIVAVLALTGAAFGARAGRSAVTMTTVQITEREYRVSASRTILPAGIVQLVVKNAGHIAHRLSVAGPGLRTSTTPTLQPGATRTLRLTVGGGSLTLWCPLGNHAAAGMKTTLRVRGAPIGTSTGTSTSPGGGYDPGGGY